MCPCNLLLILALGHQGNVKQMQTSHRLKQRLKNITSSFPTHIYTALPIAFFRIQSSRREKISLLLSLQLKYGSCVNCITKVMHKSAQKHQKNAFGNPTVGLLCLSSPATIGFVSCRILGSCTDLMQAIQVLVLASKDLQQEIVESGRVSLVTG